MIGDCRDDEEEVHAEMGERFGFGKGAMRMAWEGGIKKRGLGRHKKNVVWALTEIGREETKEVCNGKDFMIVGRSISEGNRSVAMYRSH